MGIEPTPTNLISARGMQVSSTGPVEKRCGKQERRADPFTQGVGNFRITHLRRTNTYFTALDGNRSTQVLQDVQHALHIQDTGHVFENDLLVRQQGSGHHGKRRILVSAGRNLASKRLASMDEELAHEFRIALPKGGGNKPPFPAGILDRPPADDHRRQELA